MKSFAIGPTDRDWETADGVVDAGGIKVRAVGGTNSFSVLI